MFCEVVDNGKEVRTVFCDICKAFDRFWHKGLLHKLRGIGCSEKIFAWFSSYLSGRKQRVVFNGKFSKWVEVLAGVPQGSILGPLLFLIFINDIVKHIGGSICLFAADTSLYIIVDLPEDAARLANNLTMGERLAGDIQCQQNFIYDLFSRIQSCTSPVSFYEWHYH